MRKIPINKPFLGREEMREVRKAIQQGSLTSPTIAGGRRVREFEAMLCRFVGSKYAVALNSGTSALHAAMLALRIGRGDEVLVPSFTFVATANAVAAAGAKAVFVDIKRRDYTIDPYDLEKKVSRRSKAVIPVHIYGHTADMERIREITEKHSLHIVEDAAQSLGSVYKGRQTGSIGDIGCFSFYASKVLTSGEGGAAVTRSREIAERIRIIRNRELHQGRDSRFAGGGLNMRMSELSAAIAKAQMQKLRRMLQIRRRNSMTLTKLLHAPDLDQGLGLPVEPEGARYNWFLYTVSFRDGRHRDRVLKKLNSGGIGAAVYYETPVHRTPFYESGLSLRSTEWAVRHVLSLPVHPHLSTNDIKHIANRLKKALQERAAE